MADLQWFHCNHCYADFESSQPAGLQFYITSCAHTFCRDCLSKATPNGSQGIICFLCEAPCSILALDKKLPKEVEKFFENPVEKIEMSLEVLKFQRGHQFRLVNHLRRLVAKQQDTLQKAKSELLNAKEIQRQFAILTERCEKLEEENRRMRQGIPDYASPRHHRNPQQPPPSRGDPYRGSSRDPSMLPHPPSTPTGPSRLSLRGSTSKPPATPMQSTFPSRPSSTIPASHDTHSYSRTQLRTPSLPSGLMGRSNQSMQEKGLRPTTASSSQDPLASIPPRIPLAADTSTPSPSLKRPYSAVSPAPSLTPVPRNRAGFPSNHQ